MFKQIAFLLLISVSVFAQKPLSVTSTAPLSFTPAAPINITNTIGAIPVFNLRNIGDDECETEGYNYSIPLVSNPSYVWDGSTAGGGQSIGLTALPRGKVLRVKSIVASANRSVSFRVFLATNGPTNLYANVPGSYVDIITPMNGGAVSMDWNQTIRSTGVNVFKVQDTYPGSTTQIQTSITSGTTVSTTLVTQNVAASPTSLTSNVAVSITGCLLTDDPNTAAPYVHVNIGTSLGAGTGTSTSDSMYVFLMRTFLRDVKGYNLRTINLALGGSGGTEHESYRNRGFKYSNLPFQPSLLTYEMFTNDNSWTVVKANLDKLVAYKKKFWPITLLAIVEPPSRGDASETTLSAIRSQLATYVQNQNDPQIVYSKGAVTGYFTPAQAVAGQGYTSDNIHTTDLGNRLINQGFMNSYNTGGWSLKPIARLAGN